MAFLKIELDKHSSIIQKGNKSTKKLGQKLKWPGKPDNNLNCPSKNPLNERQLSEIGEYLGD